MSTESKVVSVHSVHRQLSIVARGDDSNVSLHMSNHLLCMAFGKLSYTDSKIGTAVDDISVWCGRASFDCSRAEMDVIRRALPEMERRS